MINSTYRLFTILVAVHVLAACGGGGGGGEMTPPVPTAEMAKITSQNAPTVAGVASEVVLEEGVFGSILGQGLPIGAVASNRVVTVAAKTAQPQQLFSMSSGLAPCAVAGTVDVQLTIADPLQPTVGDRYEIAFEACDDGLGTVTSGGMAITITALGGDFASGQFLIGMGMELTALQVTEGGETSMASGSVAIELDFSMPTVTTITVSTSALAMTTAGEAEAVSNMTVTITQDESQFPVAVQVETSFRISSPRIGGEVLVTTSLALESTGEGYPYVGELTITAAENTSIVLIALDANTVRLQIDLDGDGAVDEIVDTTWEEILAAAAA